MGVICVFAKPPGPGSKTRLAAAVGEAAATALARAFLVDTVALARGVPGAQLVLATTDPAADHGPVGDVPRVDQGQGDLGERLERVLRSAEARGGWVLALGADSPGLPPELLLAAAGSAARGRAALIPAEDGGFVALALPRCEPGLLAGLPWSAPDTGARTLERLDLAGLEPVRLPVWFDLDRAEDLARFRARVPRERAPATWAALDLIAAG